MCGREKRRREGGQGECKQTEVNTSKNNSSVSTAFLRSVFMVINQTKTVIENGVKERD